MLLIKSVLGGMLAIFACSALGAASASAWHPLFLNKGGKPLLLFVGESPVGTTPTIRATGGEVECEKVSVDGFTLTKSTLAHRVLVSFHGKCEQHSFGNPTVACSEPITVKPLLAELGLVLGDKTAGILLEPSDGTKELATVTCGGNSTTISGAVIGEIPKLNKNLVDQYNVALAEAELVFESENKSGEKQNITAIELLLTNMTNITLGSTGFLAGEASLEFTAIIKPDETIEICTWTETICR